jgi:hypothetical protein
MFKSGSGGNNGAIAEEFMERYLTTTNPASRYFFKLPIRSRQRQMQFCENATGSTDRLLNIRCASWTELLSASGELLRGGTNSLDLLVLVVSDDKFGRSVDVHMAECKFGNMWENLGNTMAYKALNGANQVAVEILSRLR